MMRSIVVHLLLATILLGAPPAVVAQGQRQRPQFKSPVFSVHFEVDGSAEGESMRKSIDARYWPCMVWTDNNFGAAMPGGKVLAGVAAEASPEFLFDLRKSVAGLKTKEMLMLYVREKEGQGVCSDCNLKVATIGDGIFRSTVKRGDEVKTYDNIRDATDLAAHRFGPPGTAEARIIRTETGAALTFGYIYLGEEGCCESFGLFENENCPDLRPVLTFSLTNDDLKNWQSLKKINEQTFKGPVAGTMHVKAVLTGGISELTEAGVSLDGCTFPGTGEQTEVTAKGTPEGGTYRFWSEPPGMVTIRNSGGNGTLTGSSASRGKIFVEYTAPDGKTAKVSRDAASIRIDSYNGGNPIPKIGLYNASGKWQPGMKSVPVAVRPADAGNLLSYSPEDPGLLSAVSQGEAVVIQAIRKGKTVLQAKSLCGSKVGPPVQVEVVNCDDETIAKLAEMMKIALESRSEQLKHIDEITSSEEYEKAAKNIKGATIELAEKVALTIASGVKTTGMTHSAVEFAEKAATIKDLITSHSSETLEFNELMAMMKVSGKDLLKATAAVSEVIKASAEFGEYLGTLIGTEGQLKKAIEEAEQVNKQIEEIVRLQKICRRGEEEPVKPPVKPKDPKPKQDPVKPRPGDPPAQPPPVPEPGGDEGPLPPPPVPETPPKQVGLPFLPDECGCNKSRGLGATSAGIGTLQTGMQNLGKCVKEFQSGPLTGYVNSLKEFQDITARLEVAIGAGKEQFAKTAGEVGARLGAIQGSAMAYDKAGKTFSTGFQACPEAISAGLEVIGTARSAAGFGTATP